LGKDTVHENVLRWVVQNTESGSVSQRYPNQDTAGEKEGRGVGGRKRKGDGRGRRRERKEKGEEEERERREGEKEEG
jgi:hypothetical protein